MIIGAVGGQATVDLVHGAAPKPGGATAAEPPRFEAVYREHAAYVWRVGRAMGVSMLHIDDVVHDVFLVVDRRLPDFDPSRSIRAWLAGIVRRVVGHLDRKLAREERRLRALPEPVPPASPYDALQHADAARLIESFLDSLDDDKRMAFFLMEVEGLTAHEVAVVCRTNPRTVYSRCRVARQRFAEFVRSLDVGDPEGTP